MSGIDEKAIAERFRQLKAIKKYTYPEAVKMSGASISTVMRYHNADYPPKAFTLEFLINICAELDVDLGWLVMGKGKPPKGFDRHPSWAATTGCEKLQQAA